MYHNQIPLMHEYLNNKKMHILIKIDVIDVCTYSISLLDILFFYGIQYA